MAATLVLVAAALALAVLPVPAAAHAAEPTEKHDFPVVVSHLVQEDSDSVWRPEADFAQGQDIPFCVVSTLPENIDTRGACPYWLRVRADTTFAMQDGTIRVVLNRANGSSEDVTARLSVSFSGNLVTAGSSDINAAISGLRPDDSFALYYTMRFADAYRYGYGNGNSNYAWLLYDGASSADDDAAGHAGLQTASAKGAASDAPAVPFALPIAIVECAYAAEDGPSADLASSPEIKVTAYTYSIDIEKRSEADARLLAGAGFAVRDDTGRWYVRGESWASDQDAATVFETDSGGRVRIVGLDADGYDIVEVAAPRHYLAIGPVDVLIESDVADQADALRVISRAAAVRKVDAAEGTVQLALQDPEDPDDPPAAPSDGAAGGAAQPAPQDSDDPPSASGGGTGGGAAQPAPQDFEDPDDPLPGAPGGARPAWRIPQLGDVLPPIGLVALGAAALAAASRARKRAREGG